jgi:hypothetical protein
LNRKRSTELIEKMMALARRLAPRLTSRSAPRAPPGELSIEFDQPRIKPQLRRAEVDHFLEDLEGLLLREAIEEPDEGDLVGKTKLIEYLSCSVLNVPFFRRLLIS